MILWRWGWYVVLELLELQKCSCKVASWNPWLSTEENRGLLYTLLISLYRATTPPPLARTADMLWQCHLQVPTTKDLSIFLPLSPCWHGDRGSKSHSQTCSLPPSLFFHNTAGRKGRETKTSHQTCVKSRERNHCDQKERKGEEKERKGNGEIIEKQAGLWGQFVNIAQREFGRRFTLSYWITEQPEHFNMKDS